MVRVRIRLHAGIGYVAPDDGRGQTIRRSPPGRTGTARLHRLA
jgi:hypothetical protein